MNKWITLLASGTLSLALATAGCSEDMNVSPTDPSPVAPGPEGVTEGAIVTITSSGVEPKAVTITPGQSVTFLNNDSVVHHMASDPHPVHNDCPPINRVGRLEPGQTMQTDALTVARACGYHDLLRDGDARWQGTIVIQ